MKRIFSLLMGVALLVPAVSSAAALPVANLQISGFAALCNRCLHQSGGFQPVIKFNLTNTSVAPLDITQLTVGYTGTANASDFGPVRFYDDPNSTLLGTTSFVFATKTAALAGSPIITIPAGEAREITAYVNIKATAVVGRTAQFKVQVGDIQYSTGADVAGTLPFVGNTLQICAPQVLAGSTVLQVLSPNGGEVFKKGELATMSWVTSNAPYDAYVRNIELRRGTTTVQSIDPITTPRTLPGSLVCPSKVVRWVIPNVPTASNYRIRIHLYTGPSNSPTQIDVDTSDANFRIEN
jgi:hypothetical protein